MSITSILFFNPPIKFFCSEKYPLVGHLVDTPAEMKAPELESSVLPLKLPPITELTTTPVSTATSTTSKLDNLTVSVAAAEPALSQQVTPSDSTNISSRNDDRLSKNTNVTSNKKQEATRGKHVATQTETQLNVKTVTFDKDKKTPAPNEQQSTAAKNSNDAKNKQNERQKERRSEGSNNTPSYEKRSQMNGRKEISNNGANNNSVKSSSFCVLV